MELDEARETTIMHPRAIIRGRSAWWIRSDGRRFVGCDIASRAPFPRSGGGWIWIGRPYGGVCGRRRGNRVSPSTGGGDAAEGSC